MPRPDQRIVGQVDQFLGDAADQTIEGAPWEIGAAHVADEEGVAGKQMARHQETTRSRRVQRAAPHFPHGDAFVVRDQSIGDGVDGQSGLVFEDGDRPPSGYGPWAGPPLRRLP